MKLRFERSWGAFWETSEQLLRKVLLRRWAPLSSIPFSVAWLCICYPSSRLHDEFSRVLTNDSQHKKYRFAKWSILCRPKEQGGLGIKDLDAKNIALLSKWCHMFGCVVWVKGWGRFYLWVWPHSVGQFGYVELMLILVAGILCLPCRLYILVLAPYLVYTSQGGGLRFAY